MNAILRHRGLGYLPCLEIKRNLEEEFNHDISIIRSDRGARLPINLLFRWGCSSYSPGRSVNEPSSIHLCSDKIRTRQTLSSNEVTIPKTFYQKEEVCETYTELPRLIGRKQNHSQGREMVVCNSWTDLLKDNQSMYWTEFIPKDEEFRYYVFFGRLIAVAKKVPEDPESVVWNFSMGNCTFYNVRWGSWDLRAGIEALKAQKATGIDFAGIDIIVKDGIPYVLEVNSAPSLMTEYRQRIFAKGFNWVINHFQEYGDKPDHFEVPSSAISWRDLIHPEIVN